MATTEPRSVTLADEVEEEGPEMTHEEMKEEEQAVIQRQIEATNAQLETLEQMEKNGNPLLNGASMTVEQLADAGIHVTNIMEFSATIELSAPKDISKMYNFSGVKSNLPRDDINLQFCRGVLKDRKDMLEDMKHNSIRRKSLLDPQTLLLLKSQEESNLVNEKKNFWRKAALNNQKEQKPQSERNPEWLADYQKNKHGTQQKNSNDFWKKAEIKTAEKEATPELQKGTANAHKKKSKEEEWEVSLSDDTWYRAPQFHPEGTQSRRTDIEVLCEIIYAHGERYDDGTAAIGFTWLFKMFNKANIVGILIKAKKHGLVFFDGEIVFASVRAEDDDEFVVLQKPIGEIRRAFNNMRDRHADMFEFDGKRRATICLPDDGSNKSDDEEDSEEESE
eukprot:GFUD01014912.1.p1 GENE.GFUD01014912.1~~GFUD01014912.1.p1  ORF type:complete len:416 (+),score=136.93 GFUD01014912.1:74-1249(+)